MKNAWYTKTKQDDLQGLICEEGTGRNVAVSYDSKDAALIAAAPEMLAALEKLLTLYDKKVMTPVDVYPSSWREVREVIEKAKGE